MSPQWLPIIRASFYQRPPETSVIGMFRVWIGGEGVNSFVVLWVEVTRWPKMFLCVCKCCCFIYL